MLHTVARDALEGAELAAEGAGGAGRARLVVSVQVVSLRRRRAYRTRQALLQSTLHLVVLPRPAHEQHGALRLDDVAVASLLRPGVEVAVPARHHVPVEPDAARQEVPGNGLEVARPTQLDVAHKNGLLVLAVEVVQPKVPELGVPVPSVGQVVAGGHTVKRVGPERPPLPVLEHLHEHDGVLLRLRQGVVHVPQIRNLSEGARPAAAVRLHLDHAPDHALQHGGDVHALDTEHHHVVLVGQHLHHVAHRDGSASPRVVHERVADHAAVVDGEVARRRTELQPA
mmetsp:Transcript_41615/g.79505  ORF Transcript_41615/g.79505 Transcript_41615/m.79505 type:complete len:284 (+) Transcript_41615:2956-3807(+)